jgi:RNA polymerase sigma factor (sigma-70 family)
MELSFAARIRESAMRPEGSVTHWIHKIKDGNREAAQILWERYFVRLVSLARKELKGADRRVCDEEDVALNVIEAFFRAAESGRLPDLCDRDGLWRLLVKMTARKAIDQHRHQNRKQRGGGMVRGESVFHKLGDEGVTTIAQVIGDDPTPEFAAEMAEQVGNLFQMLTDPELRALARGKMEGYTNEELAKKHECSSRTIERRLRLIRKKFTEELVD